MDRHKSTNLPRFPNLILRILLPALIALPLLVGLLTWVALRTEAQGRQTALRLARDTVEQSLHVRLARDTAVLRGELGAFAARFQRRARGLQPSRDDQAELTETLETLRTSVGATHLYWIDAGHLVIFRAHDPQAAGDKVERETLARAERSGQAAAGVEFGPRGNLTLRVVQPIFTQGGIAGYLEIGEDLDHVIAELASTLNYPLALIVPKGNVRRDAWEGFASNFGSDGAWDRYDGHVSTAAHVAPWDSPGFAALVDDAEARAGQDYHSVSSGDRSFAVAAVPVHDVGGKPIAALWLAQDLALLSPGARSPIAWGLIAAVALCAALLVLIVPAVRKADARMREAARVLAEDQARLEREVEARTIELRRGEREARRTSDLLRSLLDALPVWVMAKDREGHPLLVNRSMTEDTGIPEEEWLGLTPAELPHLDAEQRMAVAAEDAQVMETGRRGDVLRWTATGRDGARHSLRTIRAPILGRDGRVDGVISIAEDITANLDAEERLRASEHQAGRSSALLRAILDALPVWVLVKDREGRTTLVNRLIVEQTGVPESAWIGNTVQEMPHLNTAQKADVVAQDEHVLRTGERIERTGWNVRIGEADVAFRTVRAPLRGPLGEVEGVVTISEDVTARERTERLLRENEARMRQVLRLNKIGIFDHDHEREHIYWSPEQREIHGLSPDEPVTLAGFLAMLHPEDMERIGAAVMRAHDPGGDGVFDVSHRIIRRDGAVRWVDTRSQTVFSGEGSARRPVQTIGAVQDITARKELDLALRESEVRYRTLAESAMHGIALADLDGRFLYVNAAEARIFGFGSPADMVGTSFDERVHEDSFPTMHRNRELRLRGEYAPSQYELKGRRKDGSEVWFEVAVALVPWQGKTAFLGIHNDITARKATEEKLRASERLLRTIIDTLPVYISVKDRDGRYELVNRRTAESLDTDPAKMIGRTVVDFMPPGATNDERLRWVAQAEAEVLAYGQPVDWTDVTSERAPGKLRWERSTKLPLFDEQGAIHGIVTVTEDTTEHMQAVEALRKSEAQLSSVFNTTRDLLVLAKVEPHGGYTYEAVNPAYLDFVRRTLPHAGLDILGRDRGEVFREWGLPEDVIEQELPAYRAVVKNKTAERFEFAAPTPGSSGDVISLTVSIQPILDDSGQCTHVLWSGHEITELKRAERILRDVNAELELRVAERTQALTESEARYRIVVENSLQGIAVIQDGRVVFANQAEAAIFGFDNAERMAGHPASSLVAERDREFVMERTREQESGSSFPEAYQFAGLKVDGTELAIESRTQHIQWQGRPAVIAAHLDVTDRRAAEEALRASEARFRDLIENSPHGIQIHRDYRPVYTNPSFARMLGYSGKDEILAVRSNLVFWHPEERERLVGYKTARERGENAPEQYEARMLTRTGETVWTKVSVRNLIWDGSPAILFMAVDVTDRHRAEDELRASESRFRELIERSPGGIFVHHDHRPAYANPAFAAMLGYESTEEILRLESNLRLFHPDEHERLIAYHDDRIRGLSVPESYEVRMLKRNGETVWASLNVRRLVWAGRAANMDIALDVTARRQAEDKLRASEARYRDLIEHSPQGIVIHRKHELVFANPAFARMMGFSGPDDVIAMKDNMALVHPSERERLLGYQRARDSGESAPTHYELRMIDRQGRAVWAEAEVRRIQWEGAESTLAVVLDVSQRKEAELALRRNEERYRAVVERSLQGVFVQSAEGVIHFANEAAARLFGFASPTDMVGVSANTMISDEDMDRMRERRARIVKGESLPSTVLKGRRIDGKSAWILVNAALIDWDGSPALLVTLINITDQHEATEALRASEERYRMLAESSMQGILVTRGARILYANPAEARMFGFASPEDMIGLPPNTFLAPESVPVAEQRRERVLAGERLPGTRLHAQQVNGADVWMDVNVNTVTWDGEPALMGLHMDVTEQHRAQEALRESEARYRAIVDNSLQGIVTISLDGTILDCNARAAEMHGFAAGAEMRGLRMDDFVSPRTLPLFLDRRERRKRGEQVDPYFEYEGLRKDGDAIWVGLIGVPAEWEGNPALMGMFIDLTERRRVEKELRESEARYRTIVDTANEGIWSIDLQGNTTFANARMAEMLGCGLDRLRAASALEFIAPKDHAMARANFEAYARGAPQIVEQRFIRQDGATLWVLFSGTPIRGAGGEPAGTLAMLTDITGRKQAEAELRRAQEDLLRNEKLATVGQLTATVSHELRNPLGTIRASVYSLREHLKTYALPAVAKIVDRIDRNVDRCDNIVTDLLDFSRTRALNPEVVDLGTWVKAELADERLPEWVNLEFDVPRYTIAAMLDTDRFRRVLVNLVENSVQAMNEARDANPTRANSLKIRIEERDGRLVLTVTDTGPGIAAGVLPRVFDPLFSTKTYGVGLGLPTVRQIVREHGGDVEIVSEVGKGTEARITLPSAGARAAGDENIVRQVSR